MTPRSLLHTEMHSEDNSVTSSPLLSVNSGTEQRITRTAVTQHPPSTIVAPTTTTTTTRRIPTNTTVTRKSNLHVCLDLSDMFCQAAATNGAAAAVKANTTATNTTQIPTPRLTASRSSPKFQITPLVRDRVAAQGPPPSSQKLASKPYATPQIPLHRNKTPATMAQRLTQRPPGTVTTTARKTTQSRVVTTPSSMVQQEKINQQLWAEQQTDIFTNWLNYTLCPSNESET